LSRSRSNSAEKADYSLATTRSFLRDLSKLDRANIRRILRAVEGLKSDAYLGKNLRGQLEGFRSLRVGDFRVIYTIEEQDRTVTLRAVGHRRLIYRP